MAMFYVKGLKRCVSRNFTVFSNEGVGSESTKTLASEKKITASFHVCFKIVS